MASAILAHWDLVKLTKRQLINFESLIKVLVFEKILFLVTSIISVRITIRNEVSVENVYDTKIMVTCGLNVGESMCKLCSALVCFCMELPVTANGKVDSD